MHLVKPGASPRMNLPKSSRTFEDAARAIMYRWAVERDTWVSAEEIAEARTFLHAIERSLR